MRMIEGNRVAETAWEAARGRHNAENKVERVIRWECVREKIGEYLEKIELGRMRQQAQESERGERKHE